MISQQTIDEVFQKADIVEVISHFVPDLKKSGNAFKAKSPFVEEKSASFFVVPSKNIFKDFSSGLGGGFISFLMEKERLNYPEAIKWLCSFYKIPVKEDAREISEEQKNKIEQASDVLNYVQRKYRGALAGSVAEQELLDRGLSHDEIVEWGLGYAKDEWQFVTHSIVERGLTSVANELGVVREGKKSFDALKGRITIPVYDGNGILRGLAGRICEAHKNENSAKYVNPDNSFYYDKSRILFGLDKARKAIMEQDCVVAVEGYMDVIAAHRMDMVNTVGICGTSITEQHLQMLKRLMKRPRIQLCADGDKAGTKSLLRSIDMCLEAGFKTEVIRIPDAMGKDLDEFVKNNCLTDIREEEAAA